MSLRTIDATWLDHAREAIDEAIDAGEFHLANDLRRYVEARRGEDRTARRRRSVEATWERTEEDHDRATEPRCEARDCAAPRVHADARGCADHWPRFDSGGRWPRERRAHEQAWDQVARPTEPEGGAPRGEWREVRDAARRFLEARGEVTGSHSWLFTRPGRA